MQGDWHLLGSSAPGTGHLLPIWPVQRAPGPQKERRMTDESCLRRKRDSEADRSSREELLEMERYNGEIAEVTGRELQETWERERANGDESWFRELLGLEEQKVKIPCQASG